MKIILVGTTYPFRGGLAAFNERLAREYIAQGHQVEVFTFSMQYPSFLFPGKTQLSAEKAPNDLNIHRTINSVNPWSWIKTGRMIKQKAADKIIFCYWMAFMAPCFGTIARIVGNSKCTRIGLIHNMIPHEPSILDRLFPQYFVHSMDGFLAMADSVKQDIQHFDKKNKPITVSPHPIYDHFGNIVDKKTAIQSLKLSEEFSYILFFGFIRHYKGLDLLLEAFADERLRKFPVKLIIAGEFYEDSAPYQQLIAKLKLESFVELRTEFIPDTEVRNYFCASDMIAQPYRSATQSGVSQIAYHFETPILVTDVGGLAQIVPHGKVGYVVDVDSSKIADALVDFYANKKAAFFIENIKVEKQKFTWSKMTEAISSLKT